MNGSVALLVPSGIKHILLPRNVMEVNFRFSIHFACGLHIDPLMSPTFHLGNNLVFKSDFCLLHGNHGANFLYASVNNTREYTLELDRQRLETFRRT